MFSKESRYRNIKNIVAVDARGRSLESRRIRLLPETSAEFRHTVEEGDRLDHLAFKYYGESRKWWRICDANPSFLSPLGLLGKEPVDTVRFPVAVDPGSQSGPPPWYILIKSLSLIPGVLTVSFQETAVPVKKTVEYSGLQVEVDSESVERCIRVTYNRLNIGAADLKLAAESSHPSFDIGEPEHIGRVGKRIFIPTSADD